MAVSRETEHHIHQYAYQKTPPPPRVKIEPTRLRGPRPEWFMAGRPAPVRKARRTFPGGQKPATAKTKKKWKKKVKKKKGKKKGEEKKGKKKN